LENTLSFVRAKGQLVATPFLVVLVFWLTVIFATFGLFASRNATVFAAWFVCALSVSCAVFLILELDTPFEGLLQISSDPMRDALARIGQ
jgi:uncharacterized membrane protein